MKYLSIILLVLFCGCNISTGSSKVYKRWDDSARYNLMKCAHYSLPRDSDSFNYYLGRANVFIDLEREELNIK
jgi:hypothetical protein